MRALVLLAVLAMPAPSRAECSRAVLEAFDNTAADVAQGGPAAPEQAAWLEERRAAVEACRARLEWTAGLRATQAAIAQQERDQAAAAHDQETARLQGLTLDRADSRARRVVLSALLCEQTAALRLATSQHRAIAELGWKTGIDHARQRLSVGGGAQRTRHEIAATRARARRYGVPLVGCGAAPVARLRQCIAADLEECGDLGDLYTNAATELEGEAYAAFMKATGDGS